MKDGHMSNQLDSKKFPKQKGHTAKILFQNKDVTQESRNKCGKVGGLQVQKVGMVGETRGRGGGHESKVATWHGQ